MDPDRFARLFDDVEADAAMSALVEDDAVLGDLERDARARVLLADRLRGSVGPVSVVVRGVGAVRGTVADVWADSVVVAGADGAEWALPFRAVLWVEGLGATAAPAGVVGVTLGMAALVRRWVRDRLPVTLYLVDGGTVVGTPDAASADHLDLAEHDLDQPRRPDAVRRVVAVPYASVSAMRRR